MILSLGAGIAVADDTDAEVEPDEAEEADAQNEDEAEEESDGEDESVVDVRDIHTIIQIGDEAALETVEDWLDSDQAEEYSEVAEEAEDWLSEVEEERSEARDELTGFKEVSEDVRIVGYEFHPEEEYADIIIESDTRTSITLQDVGGTFASEDQFEFRVEPISAGNTHLQVEASEERINNDVTQMVAIAHGEQGTGTTIEIRTEDDSVLNQEILIRYSLIGLGGFTFISTVEILRRFRNYRDKGAIETAQGHAVSSGKIYGDKMEPEERGDYNDK